MKDQCQAFSIHCCGNVWLICDYRNELTFFIHSPPMFNLKFDFEVWMYFTKDKQIWTHKSYS